MITSTDSLVKKLDLKIEESPLFNISNLKNSSLKEKLNTLGYSRFELTSNTGFRSEIDILEDSLIKEGLLSLNFSSSDNILDFGCRTGRWTALLKQSRDLSIVGIDHYLYKIEKAKQYYPEIPFFYVTGKTLDETLKNFSEFIPDLNINVLLLIRVFNNIALNANISLNPKETLISILQQKIRIILFQPHAENFRFSEFDNFNLKNYFSKEILEDFPYGILSYRTSQEIKNSLLSELNPEISCIDYQNGFFELQLNSTT